jgi:ABC-2 type transport system ATP-binding protein
LIRVENLVKNYGDVKAVRGIDFEVNDGEILGFLGENGAGKSTTLKIITSFLSPTSGNVHVNDLNILDHSLEIRKQIGYLPELNPLYMDMRVFDLLEFSARVRNIEGKAFKQSMARVIEQCGLNGVVHKRVSDLSKGYKQRLGLATAIIHDPKILILDEPVTGLDPNQIVEIRELIKSLGQEKMVIISSHILHEIEATVDRIIIIHAGEIVANGTSEELMSGFHSKTQLTLEVKNASSDSIQKLANTFPEIILTKMEPVNGNHLVIIDYDKDSDPRESIFNFATEKGWILLEMSLQKARLEDIFRKLTIDGGVDA